MPGEPLMDAYVSEGGETVTFGIDNTTGDDWPAGVFAYEFAVHRDGMLVQGENDALPATGPGVLFLQTRPFLGVEIPGSYTLSLTLIDRATSATVATWSGQVEHHEVWRPGKT